MTNNVIPTIVLFVIFVTIFCTLNAASIKDICLLPKQFKSNYDYNWKSNGKEWSNNNTKTDYLKLVLSWTPTHCESLSQSIRDKEFQCLKSNNFGLIVHGLWPQAAKASSIQAHPRNCRNEKQLNTTFIKRFFCIMPDEDLIQAQWEKHGTCKYKTATEYYTVIENLYKSLNIPDIKSMKNATATNIKKAFVTINSKLFSSAIQVSRESMNRLKEIKICYNLNNQLVSCYT